MAALKRNWRDDIKVFRERKGGLTEAKKTRAKEQHSIEKRIRDALKHGARTIPELAEAVSMPSEQVLWYVMAMKRYGKVAESGQAGHYFRYSLRETQS